MNTQEYWIQEKEKIDKPLIEKVNITKSIKDFIVNLINRFK